MHYEYIGGIKRALHIMKKMHVIILIYCESPVSDAFIVDSFHRLSFVFHLLKVNFRKVLLNFQNQFLTHKTIPQRRVIT